MLHIDYVVDISILLTSIFVINGSLVQNPTKTGTLKNVSVDYVLKNEIEITARGPNSGPTRKPI